MTVAELYAAVLALGFDNEIDEEVFCSAANRAFAQASAARPRIGEYPFVYAPLEKAYDFDGIAKIVGNSERTEVACDPVSYRFYAKGKGTVAFEKDGRVLKLIEIDGKEFGAYKGFVYDGDSAVKGQANVRFSAQDGYAFIIKDFRVYAEKISDSEADIPNEDDVVDVETAVGDFVAFERYPIEDGRRAKVSEGYRVSGGKLILGADFKTGDYYATYIKSTQKITVEDISGDVKVDFENDVAQSLPLLIAYYVYLEEGDGLAESYLARYLEQEQRIMAQAKPAEPIEITNTTGW